ncbi:unnamed protein product [Urochloa humidicola]
MEAPGDEIPSHIGGVHASQVLGGATVAEPEPRTSGGFMMLQRSLVVAPTMLDEMSRRSRNANKQVLSLF